MQTRSAASAPPSPNGRGVVKDWTEAMRFFRATAEQDFAKAEGVVQDLAEALRFYFMSESW